MDYEIITSPVSGYIKDVLIFKNSRIYEWNPLFIIEDNSGIIHTIKLGLNGEIQSVEVQCGDQVVPGMVLAYVKEDSYVTGND